MITVDSIRQKLFSIKDESYKKFNTALIPTVDPDTVIGVRTPELRKYAKEIAKNADKDIFLSDLPHKYYEENNLHAFILETEKDFSQLIEKLDAFLPYVDNWATCDTMRPKVFKKHPGELLCVIKRYLKSSHTYTVRYGIGLLLSFYLDDNFSPDILEQVAAIRSDEYYINMMIAWFFATALAKQYDASLPYITQKRLSPWVHNKTIQKACESNRITSETKAYLRTLKVKPEP